MSETKIVKRKKFNFIKFIIFIVLLSVFVLLLSNLIKQPIKNIIILNNNLVSDDEIIYTAKLQNYPSFIKTSGAHVCKKIKKLEFIKDCKVKKKWGYIFEINIEEYKILYKVRSNNDYVLEGNKDITIEKDINGIPLLINYVPDEIEKKLNEKLSKVSYDVLKKVSEIEYDPTTYDDKRFILYMVDGNMVYVTIPKLENLNKYNEIKKELEGKKGILYLDSGNYFEIKE